MKQQENIISAQIDGGLHEKQALLDDFAKAAMQGIYAAEPNRAAIDPPEYWVGYAYDVAQAMMQERERRMRG